MTYDSSTSDHGMVSPKEKKSNGVQRVLPDVRPSFEGEPTAPGFSEHEQIQVTKRPGTERPTPWPSDRFLTALPLDQIKSELLSRNGLDLAENELCELMRSIRYLGLSKPLVVIASAQGDGFNLIHGFRRLTAYRRLFDQHREDRWSKVPVYVLAQGKSLEELYRQMIDEDMVRKPLSYAEMARIAMDYASNPETPETAMDDVINVLFRSAIQARRGYVQAFVRVLEKIGPALLYPTALPLQIGLVLDHELKAHPEVTKLITADLSDWDNRSVSDELDVLRHYADLSTFQPGLDPTPTANRRSWNWVDTPAGKARYSYERGRLELHLGHALDPVGLDALRGAMAEVLAQIAPQTD